MHIALGVESMQARLNVLGLPHGQRAFAACDNEFAGCHDGFVRVETMAASLSCLAAFQKRAAGQGLFTIHPRVRF